MFILLGALMSIGSSVIGFVALIIILAIAGRIRSINKNDKR